MYPLMYGVAEGRKKSKIQNKKSKYHIYVLTEE